MIRKATLEDVAAIRELIGHYAREGKLLLRPLGELYENLRDFFVWEDGGQVVGCAALHLIWADLAEIKSLAVKEEHRGRGHGRELVRACIEEAKQLAIPRVLALTYVPAFFTGMGFREVNKEELPHKLWAECVRCPFFPDCDEVAVLLELKGMRTCSSANA